MVYCSPSSHLYSFHTKHSQSYNTLRTLRCNSQHPTSLAVLSPYTQVQYNSSHPPDTPCCLSHPILALQSSHPFQPAYKSGTALPGSHPLNLQSFAFTSLNTSLLHSLPHPIQPTWSIPSPDNRSITPFMADPSTLPTPKLIQPTSPPS